MRGVDVDRFSRVDIGHTEGAFVNGICCRRPYGNNTRNILCTQELINWLTHGAGFRAGFFVELQDTSVSV